MLVLELDPSEIQEGSPPQETDSSYVHGHLVYLLSLGGELPAVRVSVTPDGVMIVDGYRYLKVAKELKRSPIRAIVDRGSDKGSVETLARYRRVVHPKEWEGESSGIDSTWHVFFFHPPLDRQASDEFRALVEGLFRSSASAVFAALDTAPVKSFDVELESGRVAFEAETPWADEAWVSTFLSKCREFSEKRRPIWTYQGRIWRQQPG